MYSPYISNDADEEIKTMYHESLIKPASAGFGMWEQQLHDLGDGWSSEQDLIMEIYASDNDRELFELGKDDLPDGLEDIRGQIYNQKGRIFGYLNETDAPNYFAVIEIDNLKS